MSAYAAAWDARIDRLSSRLPARLRTALTWLRHPSRRIIRIPTAFLFILGGVFSILPILGLWMLPVGLALLGEDVPGLKGPLERLTRRAEAAWPKVARLWRRDRRNG